MADRTGQQIGNYRIVRLIGEGGFAEVYLGEHIHLGTAAAIKVLHTQLASDETAQFRDEARLIASLDHPNIVRVLDFGLAEKTPYLVMSYAPNGTLRQLHKRKEPVPLASIVSYVRQVADALYYAHQQRLVHRDVKPENMLVGRHNEILLSDFGIAFVSQSSRYQGTHDIVGTVSYMAPEQIRGRPRPASDQYSLAVVVYEWLTGERPFHGSFTEIAVQHTIAPPPPLRDKLPSIAPEVEYVVLTALAKDPEQRFGTIRAFANALQQASNEWGQSGHEWQSKLISPPPQPQPPPRPLTPLPPSPTPPSSYPQQSGFQPHVVLTPPGPSITPGSVLPRSDRPERVEAASIIQARNFPASHVGRRISAGCAGRQRGNFAGAGSSAFRYRYTCSNPRSNAGSRRDNGCQNNRHSKSGQPHSKRDRLVANPVTTGERRHSNIFANYGHKYSYHFADDTNTGESRQHAPLDL